MEQENYENNYNRYTEISENWKQYQSCIINVITFLVKYGCNIQDSLISKNQLSIEVLKSLCQYYPFKKMKKLLNSSIIWYQLINIDAHSTFGFLITSFGPIIDVSQMYDTNQISKQDSEKKDAEQKWRDMVNETEYDRQKEAELEESYHPLFEYFRSQKDNMNHLLQQEVATRAVVSFVWENRVNLAKILPSSHLENSIFSQILLKVNDKKIQDPSYSEQLWNVNELTAIVQTFENENENENENGGVL